MLTTTEASPAFVEADGLPFPSRPASYATYATHAADVAERRDVPPRPDTPPAVVQPVADARANPSYPHFMLTSAAAEVLDVRPDVVDEHGGQQQRGDWQPMVPHSLQQWAVSDNLTDWLPPQLEPLWTDLASRMQLTGLTPDERSVGAVAAEVQSWLSGGAPMPFAPVLRLELTRRVGGGGPDPDGVGPAEVPRRRPPGQAR